MEELWKMIKITNFDVGQADCFLLHFEKEKKYFNLLIDGAFEKNKIDKLLEEKLDGKKIQGIVVTHIDSDHISGILGIARRKFDAINNAFFIFNKFDENLISYTQAKDLSNEIQKNFSKNLLIKSYMKNFTEELNREINAKNDIDEILQVNLMSLGQRKKYDSLNQNVINISVLAPSQENVKKFMRNWNDERVNASIINLSSIVLLLEFDGITILMSGDGNFVDIGEKLNEIEIKKINLIKAAHHGAKHNNIRLVEIAKLYKCDEIVFTVSDEYDEKHPSLELLKGLKEINSELVLSCSSEVKDDRLREYLVQTNDIILEGKKDE